MSMAKKSKRIPPRFALEGWQARLFEAMDDFVDNRVSIEYVVDIINILERPFQYVSKSKKADMKIKYTTHNEISESDLQEAREKHRISDEKMVDDVIQRRRVEREIMKGKTPFDDLINGLFVGITNEGDKRMHLSKLAKEWLKRGYI